MAEGRKPMVFGKISDCSNITITPPSEEQMAPPHIETGFDEHGDYIVYLVNGDDRIALIRGPSYENLLRLQENMQTWATLPDMGFCNGNSRINQEEDYSDIEGTTIDEIITKWKGKGDE